MAPARRKNASTATVAPKATKKSAAAQVRVPAKGSGTQLSDDEYRRLAKQQYESEHGIGIDLHARISRSDDHTGELGAWVQAWVFVSNPQRT